MARMQPFQGWGDGSEPSGAARMVTRDGGVRYLVGLITQRQQFKSASATKAGYAPGPVHGRQSVALSHSRVAQVAERPAVNQMVLVRAQSRERSQWWLSSAWLERCPVKAEVASSNLVVTAMPA